MQNEERIIDFGELKKEIRKREIVLKAQSVISDGVGFVKDHVGEISTCVAGLAAIVTGVSRVAKAQAIRSEQRYRKRRIYDPRSGKYSECKKPISKISTNDWLRIRERYKAGEDYESILRDMNMLKK